MSMLSRMMESNAKAAEDRAAQAVGTPKHAKLVAKAAKLRVQADAQATRDSDTDPAKDYAAEHKADRLGKFSSLHVFPDRIINKPVIGAAEERPLAGVSASVEQAGQRGSRSTLTRSMVPGLHGWQKSTDDRSAWLTIDGPDFQWTFNIGTDSLSLRMARQFAAQLTGWGRHAAAAMAAEPPTTTEPPTATSGLAEQLSSLAELHSSGALSAEEYTAAKARLLGS